MCPVVSRGLEFSQAQTNDPITPNHQQVAINTHNHKRDEGYAGFSMDSSPTNLHVQRELESFGDEVDDVVEGFVPKTLGVYA